MKKKGFTLVELLVVIAVIGLLASIIIVSLNTARKRAKAGAIKAALAELRIAAELEYDVDGDYEDVCNDAAGSNGVLNDSIAIFDRIDDAISGNDGDAKCNETANENAYAAWSILPTGGYWCVDSVGASKYLTSNPGGSEPTFCPST